MPDITMCPGKGCPMKDICYRAQAKPSERQSFFATLPLIEGRCLHFIPMAESSSNPSTGERN